LNNSLVNNLQYGLKLILSQFSELCFNLFINNNVGLYIIYSYNSLIEQNKFYQDGICLKSIDFENSPKYEFINNFVNTKPFGYFEQLTNTTITENYGQLYLMNCSGINVTNQYLTETYIGLNLFFCNNIIVTNCLIEKNKYKGILQDFCLNSLFINNSISNNNQEGFYSTYSLKCWIIYNTFENNLGYGIYVNGNDISIHHNNFIDNNLDEDSQAFGSGTCVLWYDPTLTEGNYWTDWNQDGKYKVDGENSGDLFPLSFPVKPFNGTFKIPWIQTQSPTPNPFSFHSIFITLIVIPILFKKRKK